MDHMPPDPGHVMATEPRTDDIHRDPPMVRLSASPAWAMQKRRYCGMHAWESGAVPSLMSSNAFVARQYAEVICGLSQDLASAPGAPLTILELGSGCGRLAWFILRELGRICGGRGWPVARFRYWLTDIAPDTLAVWERSGRFAAHVSAGVADFALMDLEEPTASRFPRTGEPLDLAGLTGGLVIIGNYLVDSTRQDVFTLRRGVLHELQVGITMPPGMGVDHPEALAEARFDFAEAPVERPPYEDEGLSQLLAGYRDRFADARFTMPVEFLGAVRHVARSVPAPAAWLIGDYGHFSDEEIREEQTTALVRHGEFFSLPVNFDALCRYATRLGGGWLAAPDWSKRFHVAALFTGGVPTDFPHAHDAFHAAMDWPGPRDIRRLVKAVCGARDIAAGYALNALRLANYDPLVFADLHPQLCRVASNAKPRERRELGTALERVRANLYPVATRPDVAYQLAVLYAALGRYGEAIELFQQSIRERGDNCRRWFGWALCEADRGDTPRARELAARARELEPDNEHLAEFLRELGGE